MGEQKLVSYNRKGFIGTISLNRPDKRNAFNMRVWESLNEAISLANKDEGLRVVLLRGEGSSFCSGLELSPENEFIQAFEQPVSAEQKMHVWGMIRRVQEIFQNLAGLKVPTIAVIQKHCLGAALEMVACCDLRLCSKDALFSLPEARLAIITDVGGLQRISLLVGEGKMREMAFRAHIFGAEEAFRIGLVNYMLDTHDDLVKKAMEIAVEIAGNAPLAVQGAKNVLNYNIQEEIKKSLEYNAARSAMILPSKDAMEAIDAYANKKKPEFKGM